MENVFSFDRYKLLSEEVLELIKLKLVIF